MKKSFLKIAVFALILLGGLATGCQKEGTRGDSQIRYEKEIESLINDWGFDESSLQILDSTVICQHDIEIPLNDYFEKFKSPTSAGQFLGSEVAEDRFHRKWFFLVSTYPSSTRWIPVNIWTSVPTNWRDAVNSAIAEWNSLNGKVKFYSQVQNGFPWGGVAVQMANLPTGTYASGYAPTSNGAPGNLVRINNLYANWGLQDQKKLVAAHEFGHTIGILHTDSQEGNPLVTANYWCNNLNDPQSIMKPGNQNMGIWQGFSVCDIAAFNALYGW